MPSIKPFQVLYRGFDCLVTPSEEGSFDVSLFEGGSHVFTTPVSIDLSKFESEDEIDDNSDALINEAAQAAVDMFESSRGTLGQGAMALQQKASKMDKKAWFATFDYESWFLHFKGGKFEDQAVSLLEQYVTAVHNINKDKSINLEALNDKKSQLEYEIDLLNIKRMQNSRGNETVIVIRSSKEACTGYVEEVVEKFKGTVNEGVVLKKMQEYMEIDKQINAYYESGEGSWDKIDELVKAMDELLVTAMQTELNESIVDMGGATAYPNMAADVAELMEGVTLDAPYEPIHELPLGVFANKVAETEEEEDDHPLEELGEVHEGTDIAEVPFDDLPFHIGDSVTLSKAYELTLWGGAIEELPKGMKGKIKNLYDGHGNAYIIECEKGGVYRIPTEYLK